MKKPSSPQNFSTTSQGKQNINLQHGQASNNTNKNSDRTHPALRFIKAAAKKVAGVFSKFIFKRRKVKSDEIIPISSRNNGQMRGVSFSTDLSSGSSITKSSSIFKSSYSSVSSTVSNGQVGNFSMEEILRATENFSPGNIIGEGGFGTVYKGRLRDETLVAIKRAKKDMRYKHDFKNEILALSMIEHLNLVKLYGYLEQGDEQIILVEYVNNGTLREHLDGTRGNGLEIAERLEIAIDVAHAITYLHMYTDHPVIHRDIKASNILVTEKLRAKVADFGFARLGSRDADVTHVSTQVKGTAGYMDPEYLRTSQLTEKSDVYSFGVLLVELMTGRKPIESKRPVNERITIRWAIKKWKEGEAVIAMDTRLQRSTASVMVVENVLKLAHQCLAPIRKSRPAMKTCCEALWDIRKDLKEKTISPSPHLTSHRSADFPERDAKKNWHPSYGIEDVESYKFTSA